MDLFPNTDQEFDNIFSTEADCIEYIISTIWPNGPKCPVCQCDKLWRNEDGLILECSACGNKMRPLVGTIFQDTRIPVKSWLEMTWHMMSQKFGSNATGLSRVLCLAHSTTWNILHKLRRCMVRSEREQLGPVVEVDETYIGSRELGKPGRGAEKKALLAIATELSADEKVLGRIRLSTIPDATSSSLIPFVQKNVSPGAKVITDGWLSYISLKDLVFLHEIKPTKGGTDLLPHVHLVISLLKRWLLGTYKGGYQNRYLQFYLDEYVFRFNSRKSSSRGKLFRRLIEQAVITPPITRKDLKVLIEK